MRRLVCAALAAALLGVPAAAQQATAPASPGAAAEPQPSDKPADKPAEKPAVTEPQPEPYSADEFAPWLRELRRGEIIAVGAFPIAYIFTQFGYSLYRYAVHGWSPQYAPLGNPNRAAYSEAETIGVLVGAASASVMIAVADYLIGRARARRAERGSAGGNP